MRSHFTLVVGIGDTGGWVSELVETRLLQTEPASSLIVRVSDSADSAVVAKHCRDLRSAENIDRARKSGHVFSETAAGMLPSIVVILVAAEKDATTIETMTLSLKETEDSLLILGVVVSLDAGGGVSDACFKGCDLGIPVTAKSISGLRSREDICETTAHLLVALAFTALPGLQESLLGRSAGGSRINLGSSFLNLSPGFVIAVLKERLATELIALQWSGLTVATETPLLPPPQVVQTSQSLEPAILASKILRDVPFSCSSGSGYSISVKIDQGTVHVALDSQPIESWVALLRRLKETFDFTLVRKWEAAIACSAVEVESEVYKSVDDDLAKLFRAPRGGDKVLGWAADIEVKLGETVKIASTPETQFEDTIETLKRAIVEKPAFLPLTFRVVTLGLMSGELLRGLLALFVPALFAWGGAAIGFAAAVGAGFVLWERAKARLHAAKLAASSALASRCEAVLLNLVVQHIEKIRESALSRVTDIKLKVTEFSVAMEKTLATRNAERPTDESSLVNVEFPVTEADFDRLISHIGFDIAKAHRDAADSGALVPPAQFDDPNIVVQAMHAFSSDALKAYSEVLSPVGLLQFRDRAAQSTLLGDETSKQFVPGALARLNERSRLGIPGLTPAWIGPRDVLNYLSAEIQSSFPGDRLIEVGYPFIGRIQVATPVALDCGDDDTAGHQASGKDRA